jgi:hypothetical protein
MHAGLLAGRARRDQQRQAEEGRQNGSQRDHLFSPE